MVISYMARVRWTAPVAVPPTNPTMAGDAAMANPPRPTVSVIAESPMSALASLAVYEPRKSPSTIGAGAVNHRSPVPDSWIPKSVPLRAMAVTNEECSTPDAASATSFPAAITELSMKWSLESMNEKTDVRSDVVAPSPSTNAAPMRRSSSDVPARLRLCPSSPICSA